MTYRAAIVVALVQTWLATLVAACWFDRPIIPWSGPNLWGHAAPMVCLVLLPVVLVPPLCRWSERAASAMAVHRQACWIVLGITAPPVLLQLLWLILLTLLMGLPAGY